MIVTMLTMAPLSRLSGATAKITRVVTSFIAGLIAVPIAMISSSGQP